VGLQSAGASRRGSSSFGGMEVSMRVSRIVLALTLSAGLWPTAMQAENLAGSLERSLTAEAESAYDVQTVSHQEYSARQPRIRDMDLQHTSVQNADGCESAVGDFYGGCDSGCDICGSGACGGCDGCGDYGGVCGGCYDNWCYVCPGITFMSELLLFRSYDSEPDSSQDAVFETGSRWELGYMNGCGRSWRLRYFEFADPDFDNANYLHLEYVDLEYAGRFTLGCNWAGEFSGGLRWAQYDDENNNRYDDTIGIVLGGLLRGPCFFALQSYGSIRQSFQYGHEQDQQGAFGIFGITEMQLGLEYQTYALGGIGFARTFLEAQQWEGPEDNDSEDVGLFGFGFALGITR
jgi:hypothetical protein